MQREFKPNSKTPAPLNYKKAIQSHICNVYIKGGVVQAFQIGMGI